jgi:hypothetical protein
VWFLRRIRDFDADRTVGCLADTVRCLLA